MKDVSSRQTDADTDTEVHHLSERETDRETESERDRERERQRDREREPPARRAVLATPATMKNPPVTAPNHRLATVTIFTHSYMQVKLHIYIAIVAHVV